MNSIDLKTILNRTVSTGYGDLVTRHTGRAVRGGVEELLESVDGSQVAVIDFGAVGCLDISCADEIVGKLLLEHGGARAFLLRGVTEAHCEAISLVLERHDKAAVAEDRQGQCQLLGPLGDNVRRAFAAVMEDGPTGATDVAARLEMPTDATERVLDELLERRLVQHEAGGYRALTAL
ncbi:MAG: hypothetical protein JSW51_07250 [Gemmatimonadota bacterium]|nr:MAG: hypothetical protein JSW51_07250 [Gemmatimonadota bacterium]